jgi:hypothetical protein
MYCREEEDEKTKNFLGVDEIIDKQNLVKKSEGGRPLGNLSVQERIIIKWVKIICFGRGQIHFVHEGVQWWVTEKILSFDLEIN